MFGSENVLVFFFCLCLAIKSCQEGLFFLPGFTFKVIFRCAGSTERTPRAGCQVAALPAEKPGLL